MYILNGLKVTIIVAVIAVCIGIILGLLTAVVKVVAENNKRMKPLAVSQISM